ncbi:glycosyltransferase [Luteimonas mephitis]|uniref:glycosyltransferase n=1 Tax=Luteimonas mephitis TaxID=83615 RepID=UPI003A906D02
MKPQPDVAIMHVVDSLEFGGLERVVTDLAIAQSTTGRRLCVFSISETGGFREFLERVGVPVVCGGKRAGFDMGVLQRLRETARDLRPVVVHTHNFVPSYYAAAAIAGLRGVVLVNTCHNMGARLAAPRLRALYRWSVRRTRRVAMVGQQVHERLLALGIAPPARTEVVPNGIPLARHGTAPAARGLARQALGLPDDALVVGCVGRLVEVKNHRLLLEQLPALLANFPPLQLVLIGDGPLAPELQARAQELEVVDQVLMPGARDDVNTLLPAFDVFALPSLTEGLSIALLEACAASLAIVASDVGGNPEVITDGVTGRLVAPTDGTSLRATLADLLGDAALRARLGAAARQWVEANGSVEIMRDRYDAFYAEAMAGR